MTHNIVHAQVAQPVVSDVSHVGCTTWQILA